MKPTLWARLFPKRRNETAPDPRRDPRQQAIRLRELANFFTYDGSPQPVIDPERPEKP